MCGVFHPPPHTLRANHLLSTTTFPSLPHLPASRPPPSSPTHRLLFCVYIPALPEYLPTPCQQRSPRFDFTASKPIPERGIPTSTNISPSSPHHATTVIIIASLIRTKKIQEKTANAKNLKRKKAGASYIARPPIHACIRERSAAATSRPENACNPLGGQLLSPQARELFVTYSC